MNITIDNIQVYGADELTDDVPIQYFDIENKNDPSKWKWVPFSPEKIINEKEIRRKEKEEVDFSVITNYRPGKEKQKVVLLFENGYLSHGFISNCKSLDLKFFYIDYCRFLLDGEVNISINSDQEEIKTLVYNELSIDLNDVFAIVWSPPTHLEPLFEFIDVPNGNEAHKFLFRKRWTQLLKDLAYLVPKEAIWLPGNPFVGSQHWQNKIGEYSIAGRLGLNVPPFIFTNSEKDVREFILSNKIEQLLCREFSTTPCSILPYQIDINAKLLNLENAPCCFQKYIEKKFEFRVVVLFDRVFPCKIYSQDSELAKRDWRVYDDANVKWELSDLPDEIKDKLVSLVKELQLNWASIDMIYGTDDKYYFLEANRAGAHYWLDAFVGLNITKEIIQELKNRI